jgi:hypothetical protein
MFVCVCAAGLNLECSNFERYKNKNNNMAMIDQGEYLNDSDYSLLNVLF